jgi:hypothetical protein
LQSSKPRDVDWRLIISTPFVAILSNWMLLKFLFNLLTHASFVYVILCSMLTTLNGRTSTTIPSPFLTYITPFSTSTIALIFIKKSSIRSKS